VDHSSSHASQRPVVSHRHGDDADGNAGADRDAESVAFGHADAFPFGHTDAFTKSDGFA